MPTEPYESRYVIPKATKRYPLQQNLTIYEIPALHRVSDMIKFF